MCSVCPECIVTKLYPLLSRCLFGNQFCFTNVMKRISNTSCEKVVLENVWMTSPLSLRGFFWNEVAIDLAFNVFGVLKLGCCSLLYYVMKFVFLHLVFLNRVIWMLTSWFWMCLMLGFARQFATWSDNLVTCYWTFLWAGSWYPRVRFLARASTSI